MYLSLLELNLRSRRVQVELANRYELHRTLTHSLKSIQPSDDRLLFRLEVERDHAQILVQTLNLPNWAFLKDELPYQGFLLDNDTSLQVKQINPQFSTGQKCYFRLLANPTCRKATIKDERGHGKRIGIYNEDDQKKWLKQKESRNGFTILDIRLTEFGMIRGLKKKNEDKRNIGGEKKPFEDSKSQGEKNHILNILGVQYDGLLEVIDPALFRQSIEIGIGTAKGFGFGLLSLARS